MSAGHHRCANRLQNRRAFDSDIAALMNDHQPFALALVDIDNFKSINDTGATSMATSCCATSRVKGYRSCSRRRSLYRYGGEEFAVIFPAEHIDNALTILESWRLNVASRTGAKKD